MRKKVFLSAAFMVLLSWIIIGSQRSIVYAEDANLLPGPVLKAEYYVSWANGSYIVMTCTSGYYNGLEYVYEMSNDGVNFKDISDEYPDKSYVYNLHSYETGPYYLRVKQVGTIEIDGIIYNGTKYSNVVNPFSGTPSMDIYSPQITRQNDGTYCLPIGSEVQFYTQSGSEQTVWSVTEVSGEPERWDVIEGSPAKGCTITKTGLLKVENSSTLIGKEIRVSTHLPYDIDPLCDNLPYDTLIIKLTEHTKRVEIYKGKNLTEELGMKQGQSVQLTAKVFPEKLNVNGVKWESKNEQVVSVNQYGKITAAGRGTTTVTASSPDGNYAELFVMVDTASFDSNKFTIYPCEIAENYVSFPKSLGKAKNWKVKNKKIVSIKKTYGYGGVRFVGLKAGKTRITTSIGGVTYGFDVTVKNPKALKLKYKKITLEPGEGSFNSFKTTSRDAEGYDVKKIKVQVANKKIVKAVADEDGVDIIEAKKKGKTKVTVKVGKKKAVFWVIVK